VDQAEAVALTTPEETRRTPPTGRTLPLTVARDTGCKIAYLPGLSMRPIADLYRGEAKTDAKDAAVIAGAARTMSHTLHSLEPTDEITIALTVPVGFDQGLAAEATRPPIGTGYADCSPSSTPAWNAPLRPPGPPAVTWLLKRYESPAALRKAGRRRLVEVTRDRAPRTPQRLIDGLRRADEQTVVVPRTGTLDVGGTTAGVGACGTPAAPPRCRKRSAMLSPGCRPRPETSTRGRAERSL
jgi:hypothetical protein